MSETSSNAPLLSLQPPTKWSYTAFEAVMTICQFTGFVHVILSGFIFNTVKGLHWKQNYAFHGLFMSYGMVYFQGEALLAYRYYRNEAKLFSKMLHVVLHCIAMCLFLAGFVEIVQFKNSKGYQHFYSFHSWLGLTLMFVYIVQFLFGFLSYALPVVKLETKQGLMPYHRSVGWTLFSVAIVQVILGNVTFVLMENNPCYETLNCPHHMGLLANFNLIAIILYGICVLILITKKNWKRRKTPDEIE